MAEGELPGTRGEARTRRPSPRADVPAPPGWPRRSTLLGLGLFVLLYAGLLVLLPVSGRTPVAEAPAATPLLELVALAHVLVVTVGYLAILVTGGFIGAGREDLLPRGPIARRAFSQVLLGLGLLAGAWCQLYVWLFTIWAGSDVLGAWARGPKGLALADGWNTLASFAFFYLYLVLDLPSVRSAEDEQRGAPFRRSLAGIGALCGGVALLALIGRHGWLGLERVGPFAGSLLAAVAMMYFFGKFDYRFMRVPRPWIAPLYLYVAIQTTWHEIAPGDGSTAEALFLAALLLKAYLFALLCFWIRRRTLQRYLDFAAL